MANLTVNDGATTVGTVIQNQVNKMDALCKRLDTGDIKIGEFMAEYTHASQALDGAKKLAQMLENAAKAQ
jgi:hypothetical protein